MASAVKTARAITRGFVNAMKSATRAINPDHAGSRWRETGNAVVFMHISLKGARCVPWREQVAAQVIAMPPPNSGLTRYDVARTNFSREPPNGGHKAARGGQQVRNSRSDAVDLQRHPFRRLHPGPPRCHAVRFAGTVMRRRDINQLIDAISDGV